MANLAYQQAATIGATLNFAAADVAGDTVPLAPNGVLLVRNSDASSKTVTLVVPGTKYGQALPDVAVVVAAGATAMIGPFPTDLDNGSGRAAVTYSAITSVTVAAVKI